MFTMSILAVFFGGEPSHLTLGSVHVSPSGVSPADLLALADFI